VGKLDDLRIPVCRNPIDVALETLDKADAENLRWALTEKKPNSRYYVWPSFGLAKRLAEFKITERQIRDWRARAR
jgi:hypothetical protein